MFILDVIYISTLALCLCAINTTSNGIVPKCETDDDLHTLWPHNEDPKMFYVCLTNEYYEAYSCPDEHIFIYEMQHCFPEAAYQTAPTTELTTWSTVKLSSLPTPPTRGPTKQTAKPFPPTPPTRGPIKLSTRPTPPTRGPTKCTSI